jgi:hypothetical protein
MFEFMFHGKAKDLDRALKLAIALENTYNSKFIPLPPVHTEDFYLDNNFPPVAGPDPRD